MQSEEEENKDNENKRKLLPTAGDSLCALKAAADIDFSMVAGWW